VSERLDSWKEIAAHLKRDESTVQRWEKEGLPVHRHAHKKKATVYAYKSEIDAWWTDGPLAGQAASIAVLPLRNLSMDPAESYFANGMTEALINELGKISALQVCSYQSVFGYRQTTRPLPEIAEELKVDALLEGAVLRSGDRIRITANLLGAHPERHLWAETYELDPRDVLAMQREVARDVARQIRIKLTPQEQVRLTTSRRVNPEAYEAYLLGRAYFNRISAGRSWTRAKECFEKAIEKDPGYAPAYAGLAQLYAWLRGAFPKDPRANRIEAKEWAEKALELDDTLAEAHVALARVAWLEWDWTGAEREYRRAIELSPSYPLARVWYAQYLYTMQRAAEAVVQVERAMQLDPGSPFVNTWAGAVYFFAGRVEQAMASWRRALELDPSYPDARLLLARAYVTLAMPQQAIAELQKALTFDRDPFVLGALAHAYARAGRREEALNLVGELARKEELMEAEGRSIPRIPFVWAYVGLGENEQAFAWLEKAYQERRSRLVWLTVDPLLEPLRSDPRFADLVRCVGLPTQ